MKVIALIVDMQIGVIHETGNRIVKVDMVVIIDHPIEMDVFIIINLKFIWQK